jgi:polyferredoxin
MKIQKIRFIFQIIYLLLFSLTFLVSIKYFLLLILISTIIGGVFFCGFLCPFGTMQEMISNLSRLLKIPKIKIKQSLSKYLVFLRYILLGLTFFGLIKILSFDARISFLDVILGYKLAILGYLFLILFIILSLFLDRPFCNYFCIQGARYGLYSIFRIFRIKRNEKSCINCKICDNNCPMNIMISNKNYVNSLQCINCFSCISNCPKKDALKYYLVNLNELKKDIIKIFK